MTRRTEERLARLARLLEQLLANPDARLVAAGDGSYRAAGAELTEPFVMSERAVRLLRANGLLQPAEPGRLAPGDAAASWLRRRENPDLRFRAQHQALEQARLQPDGATVLINAEESPVATLARRSRKGGEPWLSAHTRAAAERLRRDFELGQLQPRVTANWSASVSSGRRGGGGLADLTETALAARRRFEAAVVAVGPELSGLVVDICCFLKGLETVERERQWPARSAKLVLRLGLESLARHYGLSDAATGAAATRVRHWGAEGYRPEVT